MLYWQAPETEELSIDGFGNVPSTGQQSIQVTNDSSYKLTAKTKQGIVQKEVRIKYLDSKQNQFVNIHITSPLMTEPKAYPLTSQLAQPKITNTPAINLANNLQSLSSAVTRQQLSIQTPTLSRIDLNIGTTELFSKLDLDLNPTKILNNVKGIEK